MAGCDCTLEYFKSLADPFEVGEQKLGWGCMVPTAAPQAYFRGQTTAATDGSLTIAVLPCVTNGILVWNTSVTTTSITSDFNFGNATAINSNCGEGRCVSVGVRAFPNIALTSVPGSAYSGATVATTFADLNTLSTTDFIQLPTSHQSIGVQGISSTGRPIDPESFIFSTTIVDNNGYTASANTGKSIPFSVPYVSFLGLPASAVVFYEVVLNLEATQVIAHSGQTILADTDGVSGETVGDHWPTPESLHRAMGKYLPHPGRPGEAAASRDVSYLQAMWAGIKGLAGGAVRRLADGALPTLGAAAAYSPAMRLMGGSGVSGQRYGRQFGGYLQ
jgi:hypothetical protein